MSKSVLFVFLSLFMWVEGFANNPRITNTINESWKFSKGDYPNASSVGFDDTKWDKITIPHTWNNDDAIDDISGYYRGVGWYRTLIKIPADRSNKIVSVKFDGVNQESELYINGQLAGKHAGGYTSFCFEITKFIKFGENNLFAVKVSNSYNADIPPLTADFTFFGGIFRDVNLIFTEKQHISTTYYASSAVFITTPTISQKKATINIKTIVSNNIDNTGKLRVENTILSPEGTKVHTISSVVSISAGSNSAIEQKNIIVENPKLWSPDSPSLYKVITRIYDSGSNTLLDEVINPLGLRWFQFSADKGFILNGKSLKLIGTNRHENFLNIGNALNDEVNIEDIKLLKEMGGNFLRVSHYPQDHTIMEMCDKLGILCSVEIPIVNTITENEEFTNNCLTMAKEMVMQDFNRPSVIIWAYMNEVLLKSPFKSDPVRNVQYINSVRQLATKIENQIRQDDPMRYTLIPCHSNIDTYLKAGLTHIPMILGFNIYFGWYSGVFDGFDNTLDSIQKKVPGKPIIVTEYGADVDPRLHSFEPSRYDYTQEYANLYHEHYIKTILARPYVSGATIWNLNDFYSEERLNAVPHVNSKGILGLSREKKDTYLQYQALLSKEPFVAIGGTNWKIRGGIIDSGNSCIQPVKVYSNQETVSLYDNHINLGTQKVIDNIALFNVPFINGENRLEAITQNKTGNISDQLKIDFRAIPSNLKDSLLPFSEINIMLGSKRYFQDKTNSSIWIPEKEYSVGSWGYIGGKPYIKQTRFGVQPASDLDILGTKNDPVFQTMREGIKAFKMDVPDGKYTVCFYWAELLSTKEQQTSVYNLGDDVLKQNFSQRIFDIDINSRNVLKDLNLAKEYGEQSAVIKKFEVDVTNGEGITVSFNPVVGEPILNAIRVYRNY